MQLPKRYPPLLQPGSRVALVAPSGPLRNAADLERATANVRALGWEPLVGAHVLEKDGYLAGSAAHRLADFNRFSSDDSVDAIWCIRGGYGAMHLLDGIDYEGWTRRPRALIGFSDITALHAAIGQRAELVTYHGPTARAALSPATRASFTDVVKGGLGRTSAYLVRGPMTSLVGGVARGRLVGGNLALVSALMGTPYQWQLNGAILVLEDVLEAVYRIDRMLTQLKLSGALEHVAGIVFGQFTEIPEDPDNVDRPLDRVLREFAEEVGKPCVANFPIGHVDDHVTLPLGAMAELDANNPALLMERE